LKRIGVTSWRDRVCEALERIGVTGYVRPQASSVFLHIGVYISIFKFAQRHFGHFGHAPPPPGCRLIPQTAQRRTRGGPSRAFDCPTLPQDGPSWHNAAPRWPKLAPRRAQDDHRRAQDGPIWRQDGPSREFQASFRCTFRVSLDCLMPVAGNDSSGI
jgi:hypothetical protein